MSMVPVVFAMFVKATKENRAWSLDEWAQKAHLTQLRRTPEEIRRSGFFGLDNLYGHWTVADLWCQCCLEDHGDYLCFEIFTSWWSVYRYGLPDPDKAPQEYDNPRIQEISFYEDPRVKIAEDFAQACVALNAEVGLYTTTPMYKPSYPEMQEWLKKEVYEKVIRIPDVRKLMEKDGRVLYLSKDWYETLLQVHPNVYVEELLWIVDPPMPRPGYHGVLLFSEKGILRF